MFRQIANSLGNVEVLIREPGPLIAGRLEAVWASRTRALLVSGLPIQGLAAPFALSASASRVLWDHLIYAYLIENTRAAEIFHRVVFEVAHGERLGMIQDPLTFTWLRTTEDVFHSFGLPFISSSTVSQLRPDPGATRRNAYYRMFGMDLNHSIDGGRGYEKAADSNREFATVLETFLREVWRAIENASNSAGPNSTDPASIADLGLRLQNMLNERRGGTATSPNLAREEFAAVAAMSWLHVLLETNNRVIVDLRASAASPEERLRKLGERVGIPSHVHSHSYFILAPDMTKLLILIESGLLSLPAQVTALYLPIPPAANPNRDLLLRIINHWSRATGRDIKSIPVTLTPGVGSAPIRLQGMPVMASATNGRAQVAVARETAPV